MNSPPARGERALAKCRDNIPKDCAELTLKPDGKILATFSEEIEKLFFDRSKNLRQYQDEVAHCVSFFGLAFEDLKVVPGDPSRYKKRPRTVYLLQGANCCNR
jgi:hypothetical protein